MRMTNNSNVPLLLSVAYAYNGYTGSKCSDVLSVTTLIKPIKQIIMGLRSAGSQSSIDVGDLRYAATGTAVHDLVEKAWSDPYKILTQLGMSPEEVSRHQINPDLDTMPANSIPVFTEKREYKQIPNTTFKLSGECDFIYDGTVMDLKTTSTYTVTNKYAENFKKWQLQLSMYRWLMPNHITEDTGKIVAKLNNWNKLDSIKNAEYPVAPEIEIDVPLFSYEDMERWIRLKTEKITKLLNADECEMDSCTDEDIWSTPIKYKYYRDRNKLSRSTKNFDVLEDANKLLMAQGNTGIIIPTRKQIRFCSMCNGFSACQQGQQYAEQGLLV